MTKKDESKLLTATFMMLIVGTFIEVSDTLEIVCDFIVYRYSIQIRWTDYFYTCFGEITGESDNVTITEVKGTHIAGKNNGDVQAIIIVRDVWLPGIPLGLGKVFPNIEMFWMRNSKEMKKLNAFELKQFPNLIYLWMDNNQIESLEENVFEETPSLQVINLSDNRIKSMPVNVFSPLNLEMLMLENNLCIAENAKTPQSVIRLIVMSDIFCSPLGDRIQQDAISQLFQGLEYINHGLIELTGVFDLKMEYMKTDMIEETDALKKRVKKLEIIINRLIVGAA